MGDMADFVNESWDNAESDESYLAWKDEQDKIDGQCGGSAESKPRGKRRAKTHADHAKQARVGRACTAHDMAPGSNCLNCGWRMFPAVKPTVDDLLRMHHKETMFRPQNPTSPSSEGWPYFDGDDE